MSCADDRHQFEGRHYSQNSGRYAGSSEAFLTDPLSMLAAAAAESESEERARSPAQPSEVPVSCLVRFTFGQVPWSLHAFVYVSFTHLQGM